MPFTGNERFVIIDPTRSPAGVGKRTDVFQGTLSDLSDYLGAANGINYTADVIDPASIDFTTITQVDADAIIAASSGQSLSLNDLLDVDLQTNVPVDGDVIEYNSGVFVKQSLSARVTQYETDTQIINGIAVGSTVAQYVNEDGTTYDIRQTDTSMSINGNLLEYVGESQTYSIDISQAIALNNIPILT